MNSRSPASSRLSGDRFALQPPFPQERRAALLDLRLGLRVDHVAVVLGQLIVQAPGRIAEEVAVLLDRAALDRRIQQQLQQRRLETQSGVGR